MSTPYAKQVRFPEPFIPDAAARLFKDPFGVTLGKNVAAPSIGGGGGGGTPVEGLDLDVRSALTGALLYNGTETLTAFGGAVSIFWMEMNINNNGVAAKMLVLGSLPYA